MEQVSQDPNVLCRLVGGQWYRGDSLGQVASRRDGRRRGRVHIGSLSDEPRGLIPVERSWHRGHSVLTLLSHEYRPLLADLFDFVWRPRRYEH